MLVGYFFSAFLLFCSSKIISKIKIKEGPERSLDSYSLGGIILELNTLDPSNIEYIRVFLDQRETIVDTIQLKNNLETEIACSEEFFECIFIFTSESRMLLEAGRIIFSGVGFKYLETMSLGLSINFKSLKNGSTLNFKRCKLEGNFQGYQGAIFDLDQSSIEFKDCKFNSLVIGNLSKAINAYNDSKVSFTNSQFEDVKIEKDGFSLYISNSTVEMNGCEFSNIKKAGGSNCDTQEISCVNSVFYFQNTNTKIYNFTLTKVFQESCYFFYIKNSISSYETSFGVIKLRECSAVNGGFFLIRDTASITELSNIIIEESQFINSVIFLIEAISAEKFQITNSSVIDSQYLVFVHASEVYSLSLINVHMYNGTWKTSNIPAQVSEAFFFVDSFSLAVIINVTVQDYKKSQPAFVLRNSKSLMNSTFLLSKSSFLRTTTERLESTTLYLLGRNYGGALSFIGITEIYINEILFKENELNDIWSTTGSVGIYCESTNYGVLSISNSVFMNNKIITGPFLITYVGYYFYISNSFITNTSYIGTGASGLSMIKIVGSIIKIDTLYCFYNLLTDGLFYFIEKNVLNRVYITKVVACDNSALKKGGASFIFDGSSRNREVLLIDSLFVQNSANTQTAAGFNMFHTSLFDRLNLTYSHSRFYNNIASLGTFWWIRLTKKNAVFLVIDCGFFSSSTYMRATDWGVACALGAEKGSWLIVRNSVFNVSNSRSYAFYIKDLHGIFENVTLINQNIMKLYSTLFRVEGIGLTLQNCLISNQSTDSIYFNVQDNATLFINNSRFSFIKTENCYFFGITKSLIYVYNTSFYNVSVDLFFSILSSGTQENANIFENCTFSQFKGTLFKAKYSFINLKFNAFKSLLSNIFSFDSSNIEIFGNEFRALYSTSPKSNFNLMKLTSTEIRVHNLVVSNSSFLTNTDLILAIDSNLNITGSTFINIESNPEKSLFSAKVSTINIEKCIFISVRAVAIKTVKCSSFVINCIFTPENFKNADVPSFLYLEEVKSSNISKNKFMGGSFLKSALHASEINDVKAVLVVNENYFENLNSRVSKGSCLNMININAKLVKNIFLENHAYEAGAIYFYCEIRNLQKDMKECEWLINNNIFYNNAAETSAGALKWLYIPPKEERGNIFFNNTSSNKLEFESFPVRIAAHYKNTSKRIESNNYSLNNHSSGNNLDQIVFDVLDTYGQRSREFYKLLINIVVDDVVENLTNQSGFLNQFLMENKIMKSLYAQKKSIYPYKPPDLFGKSVILKNNTGTNDPSESTFQLLDTFVIGAPGYFVFLNVSSSAFFSHEKNLTNSSIFRYLKENQSLIFPNEIRTPISYSYIVPINIKMCTAGEHFNFEKNMCEACDPNTLNFLENQTDCTPCPKGAICLGGNEVLVKEGFWRVSNVSTEVFECSNVGSSCPGGVASECAENYQGNLCSSCRERVEGLFLQKSISVICKECPSLAGQVVTTVLMFLILFEGIWILCYFFFIDEHHSGRKRIAIKCLINYFHTFLLASTYNINTGVALKIYIAYLHNLSLALNFWLSLECFAGYIGISIRYRFFVKSILEMCFFHVFILTLLFFRGVKLKLAPKAQQMKMFLEELLFLWYIFYPSVLHHIMNNTICRAIGNEAYLLSNLDMNCKEHLTLSLIGFNVLIGILWVVYVPYKLIRELKLFRAASFTDTTHKKTRNILTLGYDHKFLLIESKLFLFKCIMIILDTIQINEESKMLLVWPIFFYFLLFEAQTWYHFKTNFHKEARFMMVLNFMVLCYGYLWMTVGSSPAFGVLLLTLTICFQIYFIYFLIGSYLNVSIMKIIFWKSKKRRLEPAKKTKIGGTPHNKGVLTLFSVAIPHFDQLNPLESQQSSNFSPSHITEHVYKIEARIPVFTGEVSPPHLFRNSNVPLDSNDIKNDIHSPKTNLSNFSEKKRSYFN